MGEFTTEELLEMHKKILSAGGSEKIMKEVIDNQRRKNEIKSNENNL